MIPSFGRAQITADSAREAIRLGVNHLQKRQRARGNWDDHPSQRSGVTALCALALLNSGVEPSHRSIQRALTYLRDFGNPEMTYSTSLQTMVFCVASPDVDRLLIRRNVKWLESAQGPSGGWTYNASASGSDTSNSQFAVLALHEAQRTGVQVSRDVWRDTIKYWSKQQNSDGSWGYRGSPGTGSMTCAGVASMIIASRNVDRGDAWVHEGQITCCGKQTSNKKIERGMAWLGRNFSVTRNPSGRANANSSWLFYYLYALERVGRMSGNRFIGQHDWYREGAEMLVSRQDRLSGAWTGTVPLRNTDISTSMALLFLGKGRRPVLISKLQHSSSDQWNRHRNDIGNLTRYVETRWGLDMTWQRIDVKTASVDDLLQTPVLFISGKSGIRLTDKAKQRLRDYVNQGGFIFAEACCKSAEFDVDFRALMKELFPDSQLRLLPPNHPIWHAEQRIDPDYVRPLYGLDSCCRTSVVYCPENLGCFWELARGKSIAYPSRIQQEIDAVLGIGANVLAYATGRELREKLDMPTVRMESDAVHAIDRGSLQIAKLQHGGGSDDAPAALANLLRVTQDQLRFPVRIERQLVSPTDPKLPDFPILFMHGRRDFKFNDDERLALSRFLKNGGVIFADAICASKPFAEAFRREMELVLPGNPFRRIPSDHAIYSSAFRGYSIKTVQLRRPESRREDQPLSASVQEVAPVLEAQTVDGRVAVIFSPYDISCALENHSSMDCTGYLREDAARLGINIILFALQQ
jgi:hypothetical protein